MANNPEDKPYSVEIDYTNWEGKRSTRKIWPGRIYFGNNQWHTEPQWLLEAYDYAKCADRHFALKDIHSWKPL